MVEKILGKVAEAALETSEGQALMNDAAGSIRNHKTLTAVVSLALLVGGIWWIRREKKKDIENKTNATKEVINHREASQVRLTEVRKDAKLEVEDRKHQHWMERHQAGQQPKCHQADTPQPPQELVTISNDDILKAARQAKEGLIAEHLQRRQINMLYGPESSGKSLLANHWAIQHCQDQQTAYTIYVDTEPDMGALNSRYLNRGYDFPQNFRRVNARATCTDIATLVGTIEQTTAEAVEQLGRTDLLIVVDNLSSPLYRLDRARPASLLCDTLSRLIDRWPQPVSVTVLLMMHVKLKKSGTIEDADVNKHIARTAHGPAYHLARFGKRCARLTAPMDNNGVTPGEQLLTFADKPYLHMKTAEPADLSAMYAGMSSAERGEMLRSMQKVTGLNQAELAEKFGISQSTVSRTIAKSGRADAENSPSTVKSGRNASDHPPNTPTFMHRLCTIHAA